MSTIRSLCIGISAHQKLEHLSSLVTLLGYESLAVFGDCFDEARPSPAPIRDAVMPGWIGSACACRGCCAPNQNPWRRKTLTIILART